MAAFTCGGMDGVCSLHEGSFRFNSLIGGPNPYSTYERARAEVTEKTAETTAEPMKRHEKELRKYFWSPHRFTQAPPTIITLT